MNDTVVVDASIAVKWVLKEPDSDVALALVAEWIRTGVTILAPALLVYEITNTFRQRVRRGDMSTNQAKDAVADALIPDMELDFIGHSVLSARALELAHQFNLPATYDAHYLALAERETCDYWTADERLWNSVKARLPWVHWLGEYTPPPSQLSAP